MKTKPEFVPLNKLTTQNRPQKVQVRVIEKSRPRTSANSHRFQNLMLTDEHGNKMRATLFNDDITAYEELIKVNGVYEIANPIIRPLPLRFQSYPDEHQMTLTASTSIHTIQQPILEDEPHYHSIASVPKTTSPEDRIDILGIVLYAEPIRTVTGIQGRTVDVREIVITDSSSPRTMTISLWNDMACRESTLIETWVDEQSIIGFLSLRATAYKGFSLATTMSSEFKDKPAGERATFLQKWKSDNSNILTDRLNRIKQARDKDSNTNTLTIAQLNAKKSEDIMQEDKFWIKVRIPLPDYFDLRPYAACRNCGKQVKATPETQVPCTNCNKEEVTAIARASFTFEAKDDTGALTLTIFGDSLEVLLSTTCAQIYDLHKKEEVAKLHELTKAIKDREFSVQLIPSNSLSKNGILRWIVRAVKLT